MSTYRHRRGSIFWALTLIGVGVLFLYQNFNPAIRPWHLIAKYWPLLIIFWGLSKLIDYFHSRAHPEVAAPSLFSAGDVILLIFVLLMGTLLSKTLLRPSGDWPAILGMNDQQFAEIFYNSYTFTQKVSQDVEGSPRLLIVNRRGNVSIRGSDQPNIAAVIQETIWAQNESTAKNIADNLKFQFSEHAGQYELGSNLDTLTHSGRTVRLDMTIRVPRSTAAEVTDDHGDIVVSDLKGNQTLTTRHGDVRASNIEGVLRIHKSTGETTVHKIDGNVEIEGRGGDIAARNVTGSVTIEGNFSGATRFEDIAQTLRYSSSRTNLNVQKLTGSLSMDMGNLSANGVGGPFELVTRDKDIRLENFKYNVKIVNTNGDVHLQTETPPTHPIAVTLKKGDITLSLPATSNFMINALSNKGEVSCDFPGLKVSKLPGTPSIHGHYGAGGPVINLLSTYGTIHVVRSKPQGSSSPASTAYNHNGEQGLRSEVISLPARAHFAAH
ncbi:MAG: DUF4097 family beta strand repeat-containing protein [Acidobacteriota bacterium]